MTLASEWASLAGEVRTGDAQLADEWRQLAKAAGIDDNSDPQAEGGAPSPSGIGSTTAADPTAGSAPLVATGMGPIVDQNMAAMKANAQTGTSPQAKAFNSSFDPADFAKSGRADAHAAHLDSIGHAAALNGILDANQHKPAVAHAAIDAYQATADKGNQAAYDKAGMTYDGSLPQVALHKATAAAHAAVSGAKPLSKAGGSGGGVRPKAESLAEEWARLEKIQYTGGDGGSSDDEDRGATGAIDPSFGGASGGDDRSGHVDTPDGETDVAQGGNFTGSDGTGDDEPPRFDGNGSQLPGTGGLNADASNAQNLGGAATIPPEGTESDDRGATGAADDSFSDNLGPDGEPAASGGGDVENPVVSSTSSTSVSGSSVVQNTHADGATTTTVDGKLTGGTNWGSLGAAGAAAAERAALGQ